jgi:hypothetical protein
MFPTAHEGGLTKACVSIGATIAYSMVAFREEEEEEQVALIVPGIEFEKHDLENDG